MYWIIFHNDQLLLHDGALPRGEEPPVAISEGTHVHTLPDLDGEPCRAFAISHQELEELKELSALTSLGVRADSFAIHLASRPKPALTALTPSEALTPEEATPKKEPSFIGLRASYDVLPLSHYLMAGKARELMHFDATVRFCSVCGAPMRWHTGISKMCTSCEREVWPSIATAIIVRITRGDEVLLVRAKNFRGTFYGLVAGFLETGETLEECVRREVREETNLEVTNIRYFGNQPWPYPSGQMIGFTADYAGGTLRLQDEELSTAAFFRYDHLPEIPHKLSMARMLIDAWLESYGHQV
ncbi:MAG: NAD(+) diphosphatase [Bacteroidaceae bacterium]|nr:NAD(+) diphosphatase [Bacteroidaceae bacterium]